VELSRAQRVRLGAFVLTGLVILVGALLVLAGLRIWEQRDLYYVRFSASVSGLEEGSQVRYQGLRVGRVESMRVAPDDPRLIEVELSLEPDTRLYEGTEAVLAMSGITGLKTINLSPGEPREGLIEPGSRIPAGASLMEKLGDDAEVIARKVARVADQLSAWTAPPNRRRVERILDNVGRLTETVDAFLERGQEPVLGAIGQVTETAGALERLSRVSSRVLAENRREIRRTLAAVRGNLQATERILAKVDEDDVAGAIRAARGAMESIDARFGDEELGRLVVQLRRTLTNVIGLLGELDLAVRASREDFVLALKRMREASEDIREFSRLIAQDPSVLVRGTELAE
jgi:ABC-type transporter Mla subunit MlaD